MRHRMAAGFTLIELLMVVAIVSLLAALLTSAVQRARETGRRTQCLHRMGQLASAIEQFELQQTHYPGWRHYPFGATDASTGRRVTFSTAWYPQLLPYLDRHDIFDGGRPGNWKSPLVSGHVPRGFAPRMPSIAVCPSDISKLTSGAAELSYVVNAGRRDAQPTTTIPADWRANGVFLDLLSWRGSSSNRVMVQTSNLSFIQNGDGAANTLLLSENYDAGRWYEISEARTGFIFYPPGQYSRHRINGPTRTGSGSFLNARPASYHPGGVNVFLVSGNGRFLSQNIDYAVYCALMTPKGQAAMEPGTTNPSPPSIRNQPPLSY
jgi:prepilin-type N-terminal cleavage/methylation domain-containing protein